jgi:GT2 family glycosyltransferase
VTAPAGRPAPALSVVVLSRAGGAALRRTLDALAAQEAPAGCFEVVVVAEPHAADVAAVLRERPMPWVLRGVVPTTRGPGAARAAGAAAAYAALLLFLTDDVAPSPGCVAAHLRAHAATPGGVAVGPCPPAPAPTRRLLGLRLRDARARRCAELTDAGHRVDFRDLHAGNLSIPRAVLARAGGFDTELRDRDADAVLGARLMQTRVPVAVVPDAVAWHDGPAPTSVADALRRARDVGHDEVRVGNRYPVVRPSLPVVRWWRTAGRRRRAAVRALHLLRGAGDPVARLLAALLVPLDRAALRAHWAALYGRLHRYWYLRGVTGELRSAAALDRFADEPAPDAVPFAIDLREGIAAAEARLDAARPARVLLRHGEHAVGELPAAPAAEPWRGAHLRPFLLREAAPALLRALVLDGVVAPVGPADRERLARHVAELAPRLGPDGDHAMWEEQYAQWDRLDRERAASERAASERA